MLSHERAEYQAQNQILQEENHHLFLKIRGQAAASEDETAQLVAQLKQAHERVTELEQIVWAQTEQVRFLQLQRVMERDPAKSRSPSPAPREKKASLQQAKTSASPVLRNKLEYSCETDELTGALKRLQEWPQSVQAVNM